MFTRSRFRLLYTAVENPVEKPVENRLSQCKYKHFDVSPWVLCCRVKLFIYKNLLLSR